MAAVTNALLAALGVTYRTDFKAGLAMSPNHWNQVATEVPSTSASNTYGWLGEMPSLRKWIGDRVIKDVAAHGYSLTNESYEGTVGVKRTDIEDDAVGVYKPLMQELGRAAGIFPDQLVFALLGAGEATLCYDGQYFFDTDHPVGAGTISNVTAGAAQPWYLLDCTRAIKPLIFQSRKKPKLVSMTKEDDEQVFTSAKFRYGVDMRCNAGFSFWQMAHKAKVELNADNFEAAYASMQELKSDEGKPMGITPSLMVVPPKLRSAAAKIVAETNENAGANPNAKIVDVLVSPWL
ncbi:Mu-like prophage major head subunit gpT family protein [Desulfovibrio sp. JC010]|uniref:Mu-like prophage major head subunit gpT family protein n=1 Tax=Desulfovibrio sp. JC010 TaxID=2593641 RepID=UPI0013CF7E62|nr:Mu-like prophage major head subunit gpT family protein [Desulfovibrio sp. JC010]NDV27723.1 head protein [Desulfovibrio sp. JC010]